MTTVARNRDSSKQTDAETSSSEPTAHETGEPTANTTTAESAAVDVPPGTDDFQTQQVPERLIEDLGTIFKLLADETRLRILFYLTRRGELHVRALCDLLDQSQPAVSHHLAMLRTAGMIEPRRDGKHNYYRVLPESFEHLVDLVFEAIPHSENRIRFDSYELSFRRPSQPR